MKITIHRGINQIGGCITEIASASTRILIDLGQNLPNGEGDVDDELATFDAIEKLTNGIDAILYTHYHGDHLGLFDLVPDDIEQYIGSTAKRVAICKHQHLGYIPGRKSVSENEVFKLERMKGYSAGEVVKVGDIRVTPFFVSHSAYDTYMFLIESEDKRILHTGDFRGHGYLSKGLLPTIEKLILSNGRVDFLISEGTMLSRLDERVRHENELKNEVMSLMKRYKNVFVMCSSTDMERLATFFAANKETGKRPFVCDQFQKKVLAIFSETAGKQSQLFDFEKSYHFSTKNQKLMGWMKERGFTMLVRATDKFESYYSDLEPDLNSEETVLIYSMWKEYVNPKSKHVNQRLLDFTRKFAKVEKLHTSGHASADCLADVCNLVNPKSGIIPIHSESSDSYRKLSISDQLRSKIITRSAVVDKIEVAIP